MLKIRLARHGRKKAPYYRIVLTEHTKPAQSGYQVVLWGYDPMKKTVTYDLEAIKKWVSEWAQLSERVAKVLFKETNDELFSKFFVHRTRTKAKRKEVEST